MKIVRVTGKLVETGWDKSVYEIELENGSVFEIDITDKPCLRDCLYDYFRELLEGDLK